jgi:hypothetical protein
METMKRIEEMVLATLLSLLPCSAMADPITYSFQVMATTGPLAGSVANGTFSFDDSIIPPAGGGVFQAGLLTNLDFTWNGIAYTEATANTGALVFNAQGDLTDFCFGTNAAAGTCSLDVGVDQWFVTANVFGYSLPGAGLESGTATFREVAAVPEPGSAYLILAGLVVLAAHRRRFGSAPLRASRHGW